MPDLDDPPASAPALPITPSPPSDEAVELPVSSLLTAEPYELESFPDPVQALKAAADSVAAAIAGSEAKPPKNANEGETPREVAAKLSASLPMPEAVQKVPSWAHVPGASSDGTPFRFPKGREVMFLRLRGRTTDTPGLGDRHLICWAISPGDMRFAQKRAQGDQTRVGDEMVKQMIRAIDGQSVDWGGMTTSNPDLLWGQIGQKNRWLLTRMFTQLNTHTPEELRDFFEHCIAVVTTG